MLREVKRAVLRECWFHKIGFRVYCITQCGVSFLLLLGGTANETAPRDHVIKTDQFFHTALHFGCLLPVFVPTELRVINSASLDLCNQALTKQRFHRVTKSRSRHWPNLESIIV